MAKGLWDEFNRQELQRSNPFFKDKLSGTDKKR